jgi:hypothetical protein
MVFQIYKNLRFLSSAVPAVPVPLISLPGEPEVEVLDVMWSKT